MHIIRATARRALLLTTVCALAVAGAPPAAASGKPLPRDGIYHSLKVDDVPAAYVVLVDTSSSMQDKGPDGKPLYSTVKKRLAAFLKTLTPADEVAVVTFGRATSVVHPLSAANRTRKLFSEELPRSAEEAASDHGAALEVAADQLDRSSAPVGAVLLLTDGSVNAPHSPYARLGTPAWQQLRQRYDALAGDRDIIGYGVPLAEGTQVSEVLGSAFGAPRILPVDPAALGSQLADAKDRVRAEKAESVLRPDQGARIAVSVRGDGVTRHGDGTVALAAGGRTGSRSETVRVTLTSHAAHVPLRVRLTAEAAGGDTAVRLAAPVAPVTVEPGRSRTVPVRLDWSQEGAFGLLPGTRDFRAGLTLRAEVSSPWTPTVRSSIGYAKFSTGRPTVTDVDVLGTVPARTPGWLYPLVLLLALLGTAAAWRSYRRRHPKLSGALVVTDLRSGERQTIPLAGREVSRDTDAGDVRARVTVRGRLEGDRVVLALDCVREAPRPGEERLRDSGTCDLGKSTVLCGIGFSHETHSRSSVTVH
ncbi:VWA domain-containing protein [Streptomyces sp. NPDC048566]|uniref:VWA domain-containing protein n=1 Tax=Streptomyces sp. NPDC048566 TaxID=3365569 RepID=UPI003721CC8E